MELFFNLLWLLISLVLIAFYWRRAVRPGHSQQTGKGLVALLLLVVLLLPVISATDDLVAMASPSEAEHIVRRCEMPLLLIGQYPAAAFSVGMLATLLFVGLSLLGGLLARVAPRPNRLTLLDGFGSAAGIRPPPQVALLAA